MSGGRGPVSIDIPKGRYIPHFAAQAVDHAPGGRHQPERAHTDFHAPAGPSTAVMPFENLTGDPEQLDVAIGLTVDLVTEMNRFQDIGTPC